MEVDNQLILPVFWFKICTYATLQHREVALELRLRVFADLDHCSNGVSKRTDFA